jgi:hypothetical protein
MLKQGSYPLLRLSAALSFPVFLREMRKAVAAGKKKKTLAATKASAASASGLGHPNGGGGEARTTCDTL